MTFLFPKVPSPELQPYEAPFGRMMLAYGRAFAAVVALVTSCKGSEAEAVLFVTQAGTEELPKRVRRLFRAKLSKEEFGRMDEAVSHLKTLAGKRHQLIHGEWWFNVFENGRLVIRDARHRKKQTEFYITHLGSVSADDLDQWAKQLNEIANVLDDTEFRFRKRTKDADQRQPQYPAPIRTVTGGD